MFFHQRTFEFASDVVTVVVTSMVINRRRWLLCSVTGPGDNG